MCHKNSSCEKIEDLHRRITQEFCGENDLDYEEGYCVEFAVALQKNLECTGARSRVIALQTKDKTELIHCILLFEGESFDWKGKNAIERWKKWLEKYRGGYPEGTTIWDKNPEISWAYTTPETSENELPKHLRVRQRMRQLFPEGTTPQAQTNTPA